MQNCNGKVKRFYVAVMVIAILTIIAYVIFLMPFRKKVDVVMEGIVWSENSYMDNTKTVIYLDGKYVKYILPILCENYFEGNISLDYLKSGSEICMPILIEQKNGIGCGVCNYRYGTRLHSLGIIYFTDNMERVLIRLSSEEEYDYIAFPAANAEEIKKYETVYIGE